MEGVVLLQYDTGIRTDGMTCVVPVSLHTLHGQLNVRDTDSNMAITVHELTMG